jgi:hypothetical protein
MASHLMFNQNLISVKFESVIFGMKCTISKNLVNLNNSVKNVVGSSDNGFQKMERANMELLEMNQATIHLPLLHPTMDMVQLLMLNQLQFVLADKDLLAQLVNLVMMVNMVKMEMLEMMVKKDKMVKSHLLLKLLNHVLSAQLVHLDYLVNKDPKVPLVLVEVMESTVLMDVAVNLVCKDLLVQLVHKEKAVNPVMLEPQEKLSNVTVLALHVAQLDLLDLKESQDAKANPVAPSLDHPAHQEMKENLEDLAERVLQDLLAQLEAKAHKVAVTALPHVHPLDIKLNLNLMVAFYFVFNNVQSFLC